MHLNADNRPGPDLEQKLSIVIPCLNEHATIHALCDKLASLYPRSEVIVVDDGSDPPIPAISNVQIVRHPYRVGNGAAIKTGVRHASREFVVFMDADGQHEPADISKLAEKLQDGFDLVIGARDSASQASVARRLGNSVFNKLATFMTGYRIDDLTSGFRAARTKPFRNFLYLLPNGFSYPTTSTMAFYRCGYAVSFTPIHARRREGKSKLNPIRDGVRFLIIILRVGALFSPMRFFLPISSMLFLLGSFWYGYTYFTMHRFTNMSALLYLSSVLVFAMGILSEQISSLHYRQSEERRRRDDSDTN